MLANDLVGNAARLSEICRPFLKGLQSKYPDVIGSVQGCAWRGHHLHKKGSKEIDPDLAHEHRLEKGLCSLHLLGAGLRIKMCRRCIINEEALREGLGVFEEAIRKRFISINERMRRHES